VPKFQKIKKGALDQHGPEHFEVQPFDTTGLQSCQNNSISLLIALAHDINNSSI